MFRQNGKQGDLDQNRTEKSRRRRQLQTAKMTEPGEGGTLKGSVELVCRIGEERTYSGNIKAVVHGELR